MIEIRTGKPGSGKTATLIDELIKETNKSGRPVYYCNVPECSVPGWQEFPDPREWQDLPASAILFVDESQKYFPVRKSDQAPEYVTALSEHRHKGIDLYLITQDGMLVDVWVRRLAGRHVHVVRTGVGNWISVTTWNNFVTDPTDSRAVSQGTQVRRQLPRRVFGLYKSADLHTQQVRPPVRRLVTLALVIIAMIGLLLFAWHRFSSKTDKIVGPSAPPVVHNPVARFPGLTRDKIDYTSAFVPEIVGLPWSADFYRRLVEAQELPVIMGCTVMTIGRQTSCNCQDEQGGLVPMSYRQCIEFHENLPYDWSGRRQQIKDALAADLDARKGTGVSSSALASGGEREGAARAPAA